MTNRRILTGIAIVALAAAVLALVILLWGGNAKSGSELPGTGIPDYMVTGNDGTVYLFSGDRISAMASDGHLLYNYTVPDDYGFCSRWLTDLSGDRYYMSDSDAPITTSDSGTLYVYLKQGNSRSAGSIRRYDYNDTTASAGAGTGLLVAIGPAGQTLWIATVNDLTVKFEYQQPSSDVSLYARNGRVYVFHDYNETVLGQDGAVLWTAGNVSARGAVDDEGNLYIVGATGSLTGTKNLYVVETTGPMAGQPVPAPGVGSAGVSWDCRLPARLVVSYGPDGSLRWNQTLSDPASPQGTLDSLPLYDGGIVYVPSKTSVTAFGSNGTMLWTKTFDSADYPYNFTYNPPPYDLLVDQGFRIYPLMPFDAQGNLYVEHPIANAAGPSAVSYLIKLSPDGQEISSRVIYSINYSSASDSLLFDTTVQRYSPAPGPGNIDGLATGTLSAYDPGTGACLWNYTVPVDRPTTLNVTAENLDSLIPADELGYLNREFNSTAGDSSQHYVAGGVQSFDVYPGKGMVFVSFETQNFDYPIVFGQSRYEYSGGVYALDDNGTLLWSVPTSPGEHVLSASNSTILFSAGDGKVYAKAVGVVAGGVAAVSLLYLAFGFFAGTVTRARGRVEHNRNRLAILDYVAVNPGSTLYEIARGTGINRGTVRYHLFILGANHRVVAHEAGEKFVRYFTNANSYTSVERSLLSLLRREPLQKTLQIIVERPGISGPELANALGVSTTAANRKIALLTENGIIEPAAGIGNGHGYHIRPECGEPVKKAMGVIRPDVE